MLIDHVADCNRERPNSKTGCGELLFVSDTGGFGDGRYFGSGTGKGTGYGTGNTAEGDGDSRGPKGKALVMAAVPGERDLLTAAMEAVIFGEPP